MSHRFLRHTRTIALVSGLFLFGVLLFRLGWKDILNNLRMVGWYVTIVFLIGITALFFHSFAWLQTFKLASVKPSFWFLLMSKFTGEAINTVTPANFVGGDPFRVYFIKNRIPLGEAAASVVIDRTLYTMATISMVVLGLAAVLMYVSDLPPNIKYGLPVAVIVVALFVVFIFFTQRKGLFSLLLTLLKKLRIKREFSEKTLDRFARLDNRISDFYTKCPSGFAVALLSHLSGRFLAVVEIFFIGRLIDHTFGFFPSFVLVALATLINVIFTFVPASVGVLEGAFGGVSYLLNIDPSVGVAVQIIRRVRQLMVTAIGFAIIAFYGKGKVEEEELAEAAVELASSSATVEKRAAPLSGGS